MARIYLVGVISLFANFRQLNAQPTFPEWRGSTVLPQGVWIASPIVAVGEIVNVRTYGEQFVDTLPWPMSPDVHRLYWCQGDFKLTTIVKGELRPPTKKYLWASSLPGCNLWDDDPRLIFSRFKTRVWFLREEGEFLRPPFDGGTDRFIGFFAKWDESPARLRDGSLEHSCSRHPQTATRLRTTPAISGMSATSDASS